MNCSSITRSMTVGMSTSLAGRFDHHNLMMVAGADDLCAFLSDDDIVTRVKVIPANKQAKHSGYAELERLDYSLTGGAHYEVHGIDGFTKNIWLCPVTLFVLGNYPAYIYLKKID